MKYVHLEENTNKILGWYDDKIHSTIPTPNIQVTTETWKEALNINANFYDKDTDTFIFKNFSSDEEKEKQRILSIKQKAQSLILEKYPLEKQSSANLGLYGQEYLDNMKAYILNIITVSNEAETNGTDLEDIKWNLQGGN